MSGNGIPIGRISVLALFLACIAFTGCSLPTSEEYGIQVGTKSITLEWDPPPSIFTIPQLAVSQYFVYIRSHGTATWRQIGGVPASENPGITIYHADYGNGWYDFAVASCNYLGEESGLHSSMDANARPFGGWFLKWDYSE